MRRMSWVIIAFNVLMLVWIVSAVAGSADNCANETQFRDACEAGTATGVGIGIAFILFLTAIGDVILGVIYLVTNKTATNKTSQGPTRECPHCKSSIRADASVCPHCQRESVPWVLRDGVWWCGDYQYDPKTKDWVKG